MHCSIDIEMKILILDGNAEHATYISNELKLVGYESCIENTLLNGAKRLAENAFELCLIDSQMIHNKVDFEHTLLLESISDVIIFILLNTNSDRDRIKDLELGDIIFLYKPIDRLELFKQLELIMMQ